MRAFKYKIGWLILIILLFAGCASIEKAESLHRQGEKQQALEMAISLLEDDSSKVRLRAVKLIGKIGGSDAGPALHQRLGDEDARVRREVVRRLGNLQYEPAADDLADLVPESGTDMLRALADAFRDYGKTGIDLLVARYDSPSQSSNRGAYKALLIIIGPEIADSVSKLLKGRSFFENRDTFDILRSIKNPRVATLMLPYLADEEVADQVIEAMRHLGSNAVEATISALQKQKKSGELLVTERLIRILGLLKAKQGIDMLESYSQHDSERIRSAVDHSLFQIRGF
ncbi:MAG: HEAT repeat domain-containing protein [SAR324 cluster bacterium]|nr:HEAT repeat domain-containing protein [SAR324 cluster bacterium]MBL7034537.1 HEAT repeat domain-containing protein [SAR324 cluster bacterium]